MRSRIFCFAVVLLATTSGAWALAEMEPNSDRASANGPFTFPQTITGGAQNDGSTYLSDFFSFSGTSGITYRFVCSVVNGSTFAPLDPGLALWPSTGPELVIVDAYGDNQGETLQWSCTANGTYYLEVYEATSTPNGIATYSVAATTVTGVGNWELY